MTLEELQNLLNSSGFPVTYRKWPIGKAPSLPWVAYYFSRSNTFAADGTVYYETPRYTVELYCQEKDPAIEKRLESVLSPFVWTKTEIDLPDEKMLMIVYEIDN